jgi:3-(methylthio)propanoyl-CoA dehydrogenase
MFTMMNNARLGVGLQGVALSERAYQQARAYAAERVQGRDRTGPLKIIHHPDVRRTLLTMRAQTEALRALAYFTAACLDRAHRHPDAAVRARELATLELLTPVVKALSTDIGVEVASQGVQVHGGMGYVEETGAAQLYRDVRIAPIYEGTNGIQALDLVRRKIARDGGEALGQFMARMAADDARFQQAPGDDMAVLRQARDTRPCARLADRRAET